MLGFFGYNDLVICLHEWINESESYNINQLCFEVENSCKQIVSL